MRNLAVFALIFTYEIERGAGSPVVALGVESKRGPEGIAAKEPCEPWPLSDSGCPVSRNQPSSQDTGLFTMP